MHGVLGSPSRAVLGMGKLDLEADSKEEGFPAKGGAVITEMQLGQGFLPNMRILGWFFGIYRNWSRFGGLETSNGTKLGAANSICCGFYGKETKYAHFRR